jgi:citrate lyase subunit beta/citryl-CoA lyase
MSFRLDIARSFLFVPASRPDRFEKACSSSADAVIIDLEDAVPPADKINARASVASWLTATRHVYIRINGADTPWFRDDCALATLPGVAGVILPKAERMEDMFTVACMGGGTPVLPMIETALGYNNVHVIARSRGVERLVFGSIDFQLDLGIVGNDSGLLAFRSGLVLASRLAGLPGPIDGVSTAISDDTTFVADAARSRQLGFSGKLCIHPRQIDAVNTAFMPSQEEVSWAHRVVSAAAAAGGAAVAVDGKMVDMPVVTKAQTIIQEAAGRKLAAARNGEV